MAKRPKNDASVEPANIVGGPTKLNIDDLSERQQRGLDLWQASQAKSTITALISDEETLWFSQSDPTRTYRVVRDMRNRRGAMVPEYRCACEDFKKNGTIDCKHIVAEKFRRGDIVLTGNAPKVRKGEKQAERRPARERFAHDGRTIRASQRTARQKMPARIPELTVSIKRAFDALSRGIVVPLKPQRYKGGKKGAPLSTRAMALVAKIALGQSADGMLQEYDRMIESGTLRLRKPPCQNSISKWMNDDRLTPVLREFLRITTKPFIEREVGAIIDSSKVSQLMTAHSKEVEYNNHDKRPNADWMKCHALVGVETMIVMAVEFSGVLGEGTHDSKFTERLVESAIKLFPLKFFLGDKAYLTSDIPEWLAEHGLQAVIPLKKGWFRSETGNYSEALAHLVEWYDRNGNRDFHEYYRLRGKVECLFSLLKRMSGGFCWSRGRKRNVANSSEPCTAWINELLCKFIYLNLRTTVTLEEETGIKIDYMVPSRRFPAPDEPLIKTAVA